MQNDLLGDGYGDAVTEVANFCNANDRRVTISLVGMVCTVDALADQGITLEELADQTKTMAAIADWSPMPADLPDPIEGYVWLPASVTMWVQMPLEMMQATFANRGDTIRETCLIVHTITDRSNPKAGQLVGNIALKPDLAYSIAAVVEQDKHLEAAAVFIGASAPNRPPMGVILNKAKDEDRQLNGQEVKDFYTVLDTPPFITTEDNRLMYLGDNGKTATYVCDDLVLDIANHLVTMQPTTNDDQDKPIEDMTQEEVLLRMVDIFRNDVVAVLGFSPRQKR